MSHVLIGNKTYVSREADDGTGYIAEVDDDMKETVIEGQTFPDYWDAENALLGFAMSTTQPNH